MQEQGLKKYFWHVWMFKSLLKKKTGIAEVLLTQVEVTMDGKGYTRMTYWIDEYLLSIP